MFQRIVLLSALLCLLNVAMDAAQRHEVNRSKEPVVIIID